MPVRTEEETRAVPERASAPQSSEAAPQAAPGGAMGVGEVLTLQQGAGNAAVSSLLVNGGRPRPKRRGEARQRRP